MIPEEIFKRRRNHNNTPESTLLIIANFIVVAVDSALFADKNHISWFFWVVAGLLAIYNFFTVRRNLEEFEKTAVRISYILSIVLLIGFFFLIRLKG